MCILTLSAGYYFGNHRLKHDYSYSIYLYHMVVINVLVMMDIRESTLALVLTYLITIAFSVFSVFIEREMEKS